MNNDCYKRNSLTLKELETIETKSVTEKESLLYTREWIAKALEDGCFEYIPNRKICENYSVGQIIAAKYFEYELNMDRQRYNSDSIKNECEFSKKIR